MDDLNRGRVVNEEVGLLSQILSSPDVINNIATSININSTAPRSPSHATQSAETELRFLFRPGIRGTARPQAAAPTQQESTAPLQVADSARYNTRLHYNRWGSRPRQR